jgi:hypothetical protein
MPATATYLPMATRPCARCLRTSGHRFRYEDPRDTYIICLSCLYLACKSFPVSVYASGLTSAERHAHRDNIGGRVWDAGRGSVYVCTCNDAHDATRTRSADIYMNGGVAYNLDCLARRFDALRDSEDHVAAARDTSAPSFDRLGASWDDAPTAGEILTHNGARVIVVAVEDDNLLPDQPLHVEIPGHWRFRVRYRCLTS